MKLCSKCSTLKDESEFGNKPTSKDGLYSYCKNCVREYKKQWDNNNIDKNKEYGKKRYLLNLQNTCKPNKSEKFCYACHRVRPIDCFMKAPGLDDGFSSACIECNNEYNKTYRKVNAEKAAQKAKQWRVDNPGKQKENNTIWYSNNRDYATRKQREWRAENPEKHLESVICWQNENPEKVKEYARISSARRRATPQGKLNSAMAKGINVSLNGGKSGRKWELLVGYTVEDLKTHIEKQFAVGMSWDTYGRKGWHIDHKIPKIVFNFKSSNDIDFKRCWSLSNLQPMWWLENIKKADKLSEPFQPSLTI